LGRLQEENKANELACNDIEWGTWEYHMFILWGREGAFTKMQAHADDWFKICRVNLKHK
jgi:hypothetical protein